MYKNHIRFIAVIAIANTGIDSVTNKCGGDSSHML
jgi:hypothetical protein